MEAVKITEKRTVSSLANDVKFLITQTNIVDGEEVTDVCQATVESLSEAFAEGLTMRESLQNGSVEGYTFDNPSELQELCATGNIGRWLSAGDIIYIPWTDYSPSTPVEYNVPFVVVQIADCYDENDVLHKNALWLMSMYAEPCTMRFDAAEYISVDLSKESKAVDGWYYWGKTGNTYTALNLSPGDDIPITYDAVYKSGINDDKVILYGDNRWKYSAIRQWLNSDVAKNIGWWTSQHLGDVAPPSANTNLPGWLYGFTSEWKTVFKEVKVQTATSNGTDVTYDKFFLPSVEQVYGVPDSSGVEGSYWEYWKNITGLTEASNGTSSNTNNARKIPTFAAPDGSAVIIRLRSANLSNAWAVRTIYGSGYISTTIASENYYCQPSCVIY